MEAQVQNILGTPACTGSDCDRIPPTRTEMIRLLRKHEIYDTKAEWKQKGYFDDRPYN